MNTGLFSKQPPLHYHPSQEEFFTVLTGELTVILNGERKIFKEGEALHIPPNTHHAMWNAGSKATVVNWKILPALSSEYLFENITGIANNSKTNADGKPSLLQLALTANRFSNVFRASKPPFALQQILFFMLTPFAYMAGYRPVYKKYAD